MEDAFEKIAQKMLADAAAVNCSVDDYIAGLKYIQAEIATAINAAREAGG